MKDLLLILFILFAVASSRRKKRRKTKEPPSSGKEPSWGEIWGELKRALTTHTPPAVEAGRRHARPREVPPSADTAVPMGDYRSDLRPSAYILRRRRESAGQVTLLADDRERPAGDSLGRRLFPAGEKGRETLRDAILRAEILRPRWRE